jgi:hypothetical protein
MAETLLFLRQTFCIRQQGAPAPSGYRIDPSVDAADFTKVRIAVALLNIFYSPFHEAIEAFGCLDFLEQGDDRDGIGGGDETAEDQYRFER